MTKAKGAVYKSPRSDMPDIAVVVGDGRIVFAEAVSSPDQGERVVASFVAAINNQEHSTAEIWP